MTLKFIGKKEGMLRLFDAKGKQIICTVIAAEPNIVVRVKRDETDGYAAIQLGAGKKKLKHTTKPLRGHFSKAGVEPRRVLVESRVQDPEQYQPCQEVGVDLFAEESFVDVTGISKGKGYQGVIKRHGFAGGPAAHGSGFHRHGGSTGMRSSPGRCLPGQKKAGRMGGEKVTVQNLRVVKVDAARNALLVEGCIPGARGGIVTINAARKKQPKKGAK